MRATTVSDGRTVGRHRIVAAEASAERRRDATVASLRYIRPRDDREETCAGRRGGAPRGDHHGDPAARSCRSSPRSATAGCRSRRWPGGPASARPRSTGGGAQSSTWCWRWSPRSPGRSCRCRTPAACAATSSCVLQVVAHALRHPLASQIIPDLLAEAARNPQIAQTLQQTPARQPAGHRRAADRPGGRARRAARRTRSGRGGRPDRRPALLAARRRPPPTAAASGTVSPPGGRRPRRPRRRRGAVPAVRPTAPAPADRIRPLHATIGVSIAARAATRPGGLPMNGPNEESIPPARPVIGEAEIDAAVRVLRSGMVVQGPEVAAFEEEFAELVDGRHCVAVNSGTSALQLALMAMGIGPGDEVIVPSFSFAATANAVRLVGAEPVFADIEAGHASASTRTRSRRRSARAPWRSCRCTCTATPPPWTGSCRSPSGTASPSSRTPCQAHGASAERHAGRRLRHWRAASASTRPRTCTRLEGGMVTTADAAVGPHPAAAAQPGHGAAVRQRDRRREHAVDRRGRRDRPGAARASCRVDRAAPGERQVPRLRGSPRVVTPPVADGARHVYHQYTVRVAGRPGRRPRRT